MFNLSPLSLGVILLLAGLIGYFLVSQISHHLATSRRNSISEYKAKLPIHLPDHDEAYILIEPGGKIIHANPAGHAPSTG